MQEIVFDDVTKAWDGAPPAVDHLHLTVRAGEMLGLVGPSGCGKTTVLRILGGFERPTSGRVFLGPRDITDLDERDRHFGLVTQQNQLLGHLTAGRNISFPLEVRDEMATVDDIDRRLRREATRLGIDELLDRQPRTLSEGQRRLVQLARAVIGAPVALLMDEPLAFLEDQVRLRIRNEVVRVHHDRGLTSLLVTASQHDSMAMCDRIAVLFDGQLEQLATPADVYARPATVAVARFFGEPAMNVVAGCFEVDGPARHVRVFGLAVPIASTEIDRYGGRHVLVGARPEDLVVGAPAAESVSVRVRTVEPMGYQTTVEAVAPDGTVLSCVTPGRPPPIGTVLDVSFRPDRLHLFDPDDGLAIHHPRA